MKTTSAWLLHTIFILVAILLILGSCSSPKLAETPQFTTEEITANYTVYNDIPYGEDKLQVMDIYLSREQKKSKYAVIFIHGGGYYLSDKKQEERYIQPYLEKGLDVINLNYTLQKGMFKATEDLAQALRFLVNNNTKYELALDQLVLSGFSAGAHMASNIGLWLNEEGSPFDLPENISIRAIINFSGPSHDLKKVEHIFASWDSELMQKIAASFFPPHKKYSEEEIISFLEPVNHFDKEDPPFFLWYGEKDQQIPPFTHERFLAKLKESPGKNKIVWVENAGHSPTKGELAAAYTQIWDFLDTLK